MLRISMSDNEIVIYPLHEGLLGLSSMETMKVLEASIMVMATIDLDNRINHGEIGIVTILNSVCDILFLELDMVLDYLNSLNSLWKFYET